MDERALAAAGPEARAYYETHRRRYAALLGAVERAAREAGEATRPRLLDVGQSFFTSLLRRAWPAAVIDTLDIHDDARYRERDRHFTFDLNDLGRGGAGPEIGRYHAIVLAEVIEHLYTAPRPVLEYFAGALEEGGSIVLQTPNAASLTKRLMLLAGRNPYETIREDRSGHFREYTAAEVGAMVRAAGLRVVELSAANYFQHRPWRSRALARVGAWLPAGLREGITARAKK